MRTLMNPHYWGSERLAAARADVMRVLDAAPEQVALVLSDLRGGRIEGERYGEEQSPVYGHCGCLKGTIARHRGMRVDAMAGALEPDPMSPSERFVCLVRMGDTPTNTEAAAMLEQWILEWMAANGQEDVCQRS